MTKRTKSMRAKGKISLSKYFQEFGGGESVAIVRDKAVRSSFPERLQGRTGVIEGKRGKFYLVKLSDINKEKTYIIQPVHLKKIEVQEKAK